MDSTRITVGRLGLCEPLSRPEHANELLFLSFYRAPLLLCGNESYVEK